jgi:hypothetical protein
MAGNGLDEKPFITLVDLLLCSNGSCQQREDEIKKHESKK